MSLIYTVVYMDSASGKICGTADIPASLCTPNKACSQIFNFSLSACPSVEDIIIDVFGTNVIGRGPSLNFTLGNSQWFTNSRNTLLGVHSSSTNIAEVHY